MGFWASRLGSIKALLDCSSLQPTNKGKWFRQALIGGEGLYAVAFVCVVLRHCGPSGSQGLRDCWPSHTVYRKVHRHFERVKRFRIQGFKVWSPSRFYRHSVPSPYGDFWTCAVRDFGRILGMGLLLLASRGRGCWEGFRVPGLLRVIGLQVLMSELMASRFGGSSFG